MQTSDSGFHLSKWYLDCVNDRGEAVIVYAAKLRYKNISIPYNCVIYSNDKNGFKQISRFRNLSFPETESGLISFTDKNFKVIGKWKSLTDDLQSRLIDTEKGCLDWHCLQPRSKAVVELNKDQKFEGFGYAEHLSLSFEPWKIYLKQLRWGRFVSKNDYLVWIEIKTDPLKQWVWYNGKQVSHTVITDEFIVLPEQGLQLTFKKKKVIESEKKIINLAKSLVKLIPGITKSITGTFLNADETKWLSYGVLEQNGVIKSEGWVIHELVDFGD